MSKLLVPLNSLSFAQRQRWALKQMEKINTQVRSDQERKEKAEAYRNSRSWRDDKPLFYYHMDADRPVIVVGNRMHTRGELEDIAKKRVERPMFPNGPKIAPMPHPMETLRTAVDQRIRASKGIRVFHIKDNPLAKNE